MPPFLATLTSTPAATGTTWLDVILNVVIGIFALACLVVPTYLGIRWKRAADRHNTKVTDTLGKPNGQGNIVQMLESVKTSVETINGTVVKLDTRVRRLERRGLRQRLADILVPQDDDC